MFYNFKGEEIYYINRLDNESLLNFFLAGITKKNPLYRSSHNITANEYFDKYQFEYVTGGKGTIEYGEKKYKIEKGDFFFLNKLKPHIYYSDEREPLEKIFITVKGTLVDKLCEAFGFTESVVVKKVNVYDNLKEILEILSDMNSENKAIMLKSCAEKLFLLMQRVMDDSLWATPENTKSHDTAKAINNYIEGNLDRRITLDELESYFFINRSQIIRIFKAAFGVTPLKYALMRRLEISEDLLTYTEMRITAISASLGFSSQKHFTSSFSEYYRISPSEYRLKNKKSL